MMMMRMRTLMLMLMLMLIRRSRLSKMGVREGESVERCFSSF